VPPGPTVVRWGSCAIPRTVSVVSHSQGGGRGFAMVCIRCLIAPQNRTGWHHGTSMECVECIGRGEGVRPGPPPVWRPSPFTSWTLRRRPPHRGPAAAPRCGVPRDDGTPPSSPLGAEQTMAVNLSTLRQTCGNQKPPGCRFAPVLVNSLELFFSRVRSTSNNAT